MVAPSDSDSWNLTQSNVLATVLLILVIYFVKCFSKVKKIPNFWKIFVRLFTVFRTRKFKGSKILAIHGL